MLFMHFEISSLSSLRNNSFFLKGRKAKVDSFSLGESIHGIINGACEEYPTIHVIS